MKAVLNDQIIAESDDTVYVEGNHYFPISAVTASFLEKSDFTSVCSWKGIANYYNVIVGSTRIENAAWYYDAPKEAAQKIAGRIGFWRGVQVIA